MTGKEITPDAPGVEKQDRIDDPAAMARLHDLRRQPGGWIDDRFVPSTHGRMPLSAFDPRADVPDEAIEQLIEEEQDLPDLSSFPVSAIT